MAIKLKVLLEFNIGTTLGFLRSVPVNLGENKKGILLIYCEDKNIDPYVDMFFFPKHRLKMKMIDLTGKVIWEKILKESVVPGIWFCPVFPFDLDKDGVEEIWFVDNSDEEHPFSIRKYKLVRLNSLTGEKMEEFQWPVPDYNQSNSHLFRNFILGGYAREEPVLVTAQGTYREMQLQGWNPDMSKRWEIIILDDKKNPRGSHMCPIIDINFDDIDEIMWGERCISVDTGEHLFICDQDLYYGHSDIVLPIWNKEKKEWNIFTCRESGSDGFIKPRVVMFDSSGKRVWYDLEEGHMDSGWAATVDNKGSKIVYTFKTGKKTAGPKGCFRSDVVEYVYEAFTGKKIKLPFKCYNTLPVDLNGDGIHEFVSGSGVQSNRNVYNINGEILGNIGGDGLVSMVSKFLDYPGEQIMAYFPNGKVKIFGDENAKDSKDALERYKNPFYLKNQKLTSVGYNWINLTGV